MENRKIAHAISLSGYCSRRKAEELINSGLVLIDGKRVESCALRVEENANIAISGKKIHQAKKLLFLFHKPIKYLSSHKSQKGYKNIFDLIKVKSHLTFIGRLDYMSEGLMVLTNIPSLVLKYSTENYKRVYEVFVKNIEQNFEKNLKKMELDGYRYKPIKLLKKIQLTGCQKMILELQEGKNREIRKICDEYGMKILKLKKIKHGPFSLGSLKPGKFRKLDCEEFI